MRRRPIGRILVEKGEISEVDLEAALAQQERSGRRLGEILIEQGRTSWLALARAIAEQVLDIQGSPVVADPEPEAAPAPDPGRMGRELAERGANPPPGPHPLPPPPPPRPDPDRPRRLRHVPGQSRDVVTEAMSAAAAAKRVRQAPPDERAFPGWRGFVSLMSSSS